MLAIIIVIIFGSAILIGWSCSSCCVIGQFSFEVIRFDELFIYKYKY